MTESNLLVERRKEYKIVARLPLRILPTDKPTRASRSSLSTPISTLQGGASMLSKPDPLTTRRLIVLLACLSVSLCSGTNYAVSSYSPQLARRLHLSSTQLNVFSASGNLGVYITGPLFGIIVDRKGPRLNLMAAAGLLLVGYGGIRGYFDGGLEYKGGGSLVVLCLFAFCTGQYL
jgi:hypothetical protein